MSYPSVDGLQKALAENVFGERRDPKKAAGRALGTIVEIVTYYLLTEWDMHRRILIETGIPEYGSPDITHNVEFSLHPLKRVTTGKILDPHLPLTRARMAKVEQFQELFKEYDRKGAAHLAFNSDDSAVVRNSCRLGTKGDLVLVGFLDAFSTSKAIVDVAELHRTPYAILECKRVGVEDGIDKGPQTIEKAKQGAYVAKTVSSLQKIRDGKGNFYGVVHRDGKFIADSYDQMLSHTIAATDYAELCDFVLTIGVVSNHGNWFTSDDHNKELDVLGQSYDWLLFLTDQGISTFVTDLIVSPPSCYAAVKNAFLVSYGEGKEARGRENKKENQFTKVKMNMAASEALRDYFHKNITQIEGWFNVITPSTAAVDDLKDQLRELANKPWFSPGWIGA